MEFLQTTFSLLLSYYDIVLGAIVVGTSFITLLCMANKLTDIEPRKKFRIIVLASVLSAIFLMLIETVFFIDYESEVRLNKQYITTMLLTLAVTIPLYNFIVEKVFVSVGVKIIATINKKEL